MLDIDFGKIAFSASGTLAHTNNNADNTTLGVSYSSGFKNTNIAHKTADGSAVTASNVMMSDYSSVNVAPEQYVDFYVPVPDVKNGVREADYSFETTIKNINITAGTEEFSGQIHFFRQRIEDTYKENGVTKVKENTSGDLFSIDSELKLYAGARHELFNETNREEVFADLIEWLDGIK